MTSTPHNTAYFLVIHGSSDPRPEQAATFLMQRVAQRLMGLTRDWPVQAEPLIRLGSLECGDRLLADQLASFGAQAQQAGKQGIRVLPLFLLPGVHVMADIPEQMAIAQRTLDQSADSALALDLLPYLGSRADWHKTIAPLVTDPKIDQWILLAHGSRLAGGNQPILKLAQDMGMTPAFWSVAPKLDQQIEAAVGKGKTCLGIQPWLLFAGSLTDSILGQVKTLHQRYPHIQIQVNNPIGTYPPLVEQIAQLLLA